MLEDFQRHIENDMHPEKEEQRRVQEWMDAFRPRKEQEFSDDLAERMGKEIIEGLEEEQQRREKEWILRKEKEMGEDLEQYWEKEWEKEVVAEFNELRKMLNDEKQKTGNCHQSTTQ